MATGGSRLRVTSAACALAFVAGCASGGPPRPDPVATHPYAPTLNVDVTTMTRSVSGLYVRDLANGAGVRASTGDLVRIRYTVHLADGTYIAGTGAGDAPFEFRLGRREVIAAWDEGLMGMRVGDRRQLVVPPALAYGSRARGNIPANSILVFVVELVGLGG